MLAELIAPQTVEGVDSFEGAVARLAVENRKVKLPVPLVASALREARCVHAITRIVVITNRCSCPPGCSLLRKDAVRRTVAGSSDSGRQLNSMLHGSGMCSVVQKR